MTTPDGNLDDPAENLDGNQVDNLDDTIRWQTK
jgi:hypothetical protein